MNEIKMVVVCLRTHVCTSDCESEPELMTSTPSFNKAAKIYRKRGCLERSKKRGDVIEL